jgi:hypothetical protein
MGEDTLNITDFSTTDTWKVQCTETQFWLYSICIGIQKIWGFEVHLRNFKKGSSRYNSTRFWKLLQQKAIYLWRKVVCFVLFWFVTLRAIHVLLFVSLESSRWVRGASTLVWVLFGVIMWKAIYCLNHLFSQKKIK